MDKLRTSFIHSIGDFFGSLPPRAVTMETDCLSQLPTPPLKPIVEISFCQNYSQPPKVVCWVLVKKNGVDPKLILLNQKSVIVECERAIVMLPEHELKDAPKSVMYWFAYTTAKINPLLTQTVEEIFTQRTLSRKLLASVQQCIKECGVNATEKVGQTMLHAAAYSGNIELIDYLLLNHADINAREEHGWTPLLLAISANQYDAAMRLLDSNAKCQATCEHGLSALHVLCRWPLFERRQTVIAARLLSKGLSVNARNSAGETPLLYFCKKGNKSPQFAKFLLDNGADGNASDYTGLTPLHVAAMKDDISLAYALLEHGLKPSLDSVPSPLALARGETMRRLLKNVVFLPSACLENILLYLPPVDLERVALTCKTLRSAVRGVLNRPAYWKDYYRMPMDLYVSLHKLRNKEGSFFFRTVEDRLRTYKANMDQFIIPDEEIDTVQPESMLVVAVTGPINAGKATLIRRFCNRCIPPEDVDIVEDVVPPAAVSVNSSKPAVVQTGNGVGVSRSSGEMSYPGSSYGSSNGGIAEPFPSDMSPSSRETPPAPALTIADSKVLAEADLLLQKGDQPGNVQPQIPGADEAVVIQEGQEEDVEFDDEDDDDEEREIVEIDGQQLFFKSSLVRMAGHVVKVCFFILEEDDPSIEDPDHPFRQIWEKCAVCMIVSDLSVPSPQASTEMKESISRWQAVCSKSGRDNKTMSAIVVGNKTDLITDTRILPEMLRAATSEGLLFIPLCARDEQDGHLVDIAFKVACDVSSETVAQQSQRGKIVVPPSSDEESSPQGEYQQSPSSLPGTSPSKAPMAATTMSQVYGPSKGKDDTNCAIM